MASRTMHLATIEKLKTYFDVKDIDRLRLGIILPDAYNGCRSTEDSHLKICISNGTMKTYDLNYYRQKFGERMKTDDLYLGFYLHLIQDMTFRHFVYDKHRWNPKIEGNIERLHNDYRLLNTYIIDKYELEPNINIPTDFENESINKLYPFDIEQQTKDLQQDFIPYDKGDIFFFTEKMADSFIEEVVEICQREIKSIFYGGQFMDQEIGAWSIS